MLDRIALKPFFRVLSRTYRTRSWEQLRGLLRSRLSPLWGSRDKTEGQFPPILFQMASAYWISQAIYVAAPGHLLRSLCWWMLMLARFFV